VLCRAAEERGYAEPQLKRAPLKSRKGNPITLRHRRGVDSLTSCGHRKPRRPSTNLVDALHVVNSPTPFPSHYVPLPAAGLARVRGGRAPGPACHQLAQPREQRAGRPAGAAAPGEQRPLGPARIGGCSAAHVLCLLVPGQLLLHAEQQAGARFVLASRRAPRAHAHRIRSSPSIKKCGAITT
jgi:hypothetical protein